MKKLVFILVWCFPILMLAQSSEDVIYHFKGYQFKYHKYEERNTSYAQIRKDTIKEIKFSGDTMSSNVEFMDLTISGGNSVIADKINDFMKTKALKYDEENYNSPQIFCSSIADSYAKDGFIDLEVGIYFNDMFDSFCNLEYSIGEYAGGAHPNYYFRNYIFDMKDGSEIKLEDIIDTAFHEKISNILYKKFIKNYGEDALLITVEKPSDFPFSESVGINKEGIHFAYNTYEITAYCYGSPEIDLSFAEVYPYLTKWFKQYVPQPKPKYFKPKREIQSTARKR